MRLSWVLQVSNGNDEDEDDEESDDEDDDEDTEMSNVLYVLL